MSLRAYRANRPLQLAKPPSASEDLGTDREPPRSGPAGGWGGSKKLHAGTDRRFPAIFRHSSPSPPWPIANGPLPAATPAASFSTHPPATADPSPHPAASAPAQRTIASQRDVIFPIKTALPDREPRSRSHVAFS